MEPSDTRTPRFSADLSNFEQPSTCHVAVALAILAKCADRVLEAVREGDDEGFAAYPSLVHETRAAFSDPEHLVRDARRLRPTMRPR